MVIGAEMEVQTRSERDSESLSIVEERRSAGDRTPQENVATGTKRKSMTKEESEGTFVSYTVCIC